MIQQGILSKKDLALVIGDLAVLQLEWLARMTSMTQECNKDANDNDDA